MTGIIELLQRGLADHRAGRLAAAEAAYRAVLAMDDAQPQALHCLGLLALSAGRSAEALDLLGRAAAAAPDHDGVRNAFGRALLAAGRIDDAIAHFAALAEARPLAAEPRAGLALAYLQAQDWAAAIAAADAALARDAASADAWFARGTGLNRRRRNEPAVAALEWAVACAPGHAQAHLNLGNALFDLDRLDAAETQIRRAIALDPALAEAHASLGCLLSGGGRLAEAVAACTEAIRLRPDFAQAHWNLSFAHMLGGDYGPGWEEYEWRKRHDLFARDLLALPGPQWQGEKLDGRRLLVRAEQGLGDAIQFARYLPMLASSGGAVALVCAAPLARLLGRFETVAIVPSGTALPDYDTWIDMMSLPRLFGTRVDSIPAASGYLAADSARRAAWEAALPDRPRIGLVWAGNPAHSNDARRSMPLAALAPVIGTAGASFVSLQVGPDSAAIAAQFAIPDRSADLTDLAETAALVAALDMVISVDSCVAHLAGALGVPVWLMLPFAPDWRWMIGRSDTPWYASARLFRQRRPGDWPGLADDVAAALAAFVAGEPAIRPPASPPPPAPSAPASRIRPAASPSPVPA